MSDTIPDIEILKQKVELWKTTVGTQQHFNTLQLQLRNYALTLYLAVLAAAGFAIKEHLQIRLFGVVTSTAALACLAGLVVVFAFYYMDWGYHQLLKGAVNKGAEIEAALIASLPEAGLARGITAASSAKRFWGIFPRSSTGRLHGFYFLLIIALVITGIFAHAVQPVSGREDAKTKNSATNAVAPCDPCGAEALKTYYSSGRYIRDVAQAASLGRIKLEGKLKTMISGTKPAVVLDIDETALSTWPVLLSGGFCWSPDRFAAFVEQGNAQPIEPVRELFNFAVANKVTVFFVTSRNEKHRVATENNLKVAGFGGYQHLDMRPNGSSVKPMDFKRAARQRIRDAGFTVLMNVGDQLSDLDDAAGIEGLLIPNPFYTTE